MYTLLHISDLHRSNADPISNTELISSLLADRDVYTRAKPPIPQPDAIVVSGDLVQGSPLNSAAYPSELEDQYEVAFQLLEELAERFVDGDRSRVVLIPGNHDVDWNAAIRAMEAVDVDSTAVWPLLSSRESDYRWDWKSQSLYKVVNKSLYEQRFASFARLARRFYAGVELPYEFDPTRYFNIFELNHGEIAVAAFNSCFGNDCFSPTGAIPYEAISECHIKMSDNAVYRLKVAVWHHSISGAPAKADFMNPDTVDLMISKGFRLGLHGHQHRAAATPYSISVAGEQKMVVVAGGSLCAGARELPAGVQRQYNLIQVSDDYAGATVHVREMTLPNTFTAGRLPALGGRGQVAVAWTRADSEPTPEDTPPPQQILRAEVLFKNREYDAMIELLLPVCSTLDQFGRKLLLEGLEKRSRWSDIVNVLRKPTTTEELTQVTRAYASLDRFDEALATIETFADGLGVPQINQLELKKWVIATRGLKR